MDYKKTLLIPETTFEMRGNLVQKDPHFINYWNEIKLYQKLSTREGKEFILHDGPPYANGSIHMGHALNKILKDMIVRKEAIQGKRIDWRLGWDTHGLPIESELNKKDITAAKVGKIPYLTAAKDFALSQIEKQQNQFEKLLMLTDFNQKYKTLDPQFEAKEVEVFFEMLNKGLVYQDLKPVYWSWSSQTSLAEAEIEYKDLESHSIYVKFKHSKEDIYFMIWTTTPWTLPANVGIALGKDIKYSLVESFGKKIVVAFDLISSIEKTSNKTLKIINENFDINKFIGTDCINPLNGNKSRLVWGHHVSTQAGTGLVHTAGGHGHDDYIIVKENKLDLFSVLDEKGIMVKSGKYDGQFYLKVEEVIINDLADALFFATKFTHSTPVDWRTKKPVIYRATKQWFVSIEKIKDGLISTIPEVKWLPSWGADRMKKMTLERMDWCISRQRLWGVPIPILYSSNNEPIINHNLQKNIVDLFAKKGINGWAEVEIKELLHNTGISFVEGMRKETDILDVWFDSGSSHYAVLGKGKQADVYIEGNDQYRGWFNSSLITSYIVNGKAPYKEVVTHGMVKDGNGNKMSKSLGNGVDPLDVVKKYGADILRMWVASADYSDDVKISDKILEQVSNEYRKIRNTIKFLVANVSDLITSGQAHSKHNLNIVSNIVLEDVKSKGYKIKSYFDNYQFHLVTKEINDLITSGSVSYYLDYAKDILYIEKENDPTRRAVQFVLHHILGLIFYSLAPIMPVTIEEAFQILINSKEKSILEYKWPMPENGDDSKWLLFDKIRSIVNKQLEVARVDTKIIKRSQEAKLILNLNKESIELLKNENLAQAFLVASVELHQSNDISATVEQLEGIKCQRCWNTIIKNNMHDENICKRCHKILN